MSDEPRTEDIDLEMIKEFYRLPSTVPNSTVANLIAAVEALRERVAELEQFNGALRASRDHADFKAEAVEVFNNEMIGALEKIAEDYDEQYLMSY